MKLWYSPASPFVRKVLMLAHETGVIDQLTVVNVANTAINPDDGLAKENPLGKIPTLVLEDGRSIFDSSVICQYLDGLHDGEKMYPAGGDERLDALVTESLGNGIMESAVAARYEQALRPENLIWDQWIESQLKKVEQALDVLENWRGARLQDIHIGSIAVAAGISYLDFRHPGRDWLAGKPVLTQMMATFSQRASMKETEPEA